MTETVNVKYYFVPRNLSWPKLSPGDMIRCPGKNFFRWNDWESGAWQTDDARVITVANNPLVVLALLPFSEDEHGWLALVVYSITAGVIVNPYVSWSER